MPSEPFTTATLLLTAGLLLGLSALFRPPPRAVLEMSSIQPLDGDILSFYVSPALPVAGAAIEDIPFPPSSAAMLIVRGTALIAPRGDTVLLPGDHVHVSPTPSWSGWYRPARNT